MGVNSRGLIMAFDRFQGDIAVKISENGASMTFIGGQPVVDQGLENAVIISLFTKKGWWGNALIKDENKKIGSDFERVRVTIDVQTINDVKDDAEKALAWMRTVNLASSIDITVINPRTDWIKTGIDVFSPGKDVQEFLFLKNGLNWLSQAKNPAHERME